MQLLWLYHWSSVYRTTVAPFLDLPAELPHMLNCSDDEIEHQLQITWSEEHCYIPAAAWFGLSPGWKEDRRHLVRFSD